MNSMVYTIGNAVTEVRGFIGQLQELTGEGSVACTDNPDNSNGLPCETTL